MMKNFINNLFRKSKFAYQINSTIRKNATTIFALASGLNQRCGVAVVRLSGIKSNDILLKLTKKDNINQYEPRKMYLRDLWHPITNKKIDKGLVVLFKG
jgi:tRNA U34 5-carboxymethylaminomethyl modifying GTPase MnmE/TrmE